MNAFDDLRYAPFQRRRLRQFMAWERAIDYAQVIGLVVLVWQGPYQYEFRAAVVYLLGRILLAVKWRDA